MSQAKQLRFYKDLSKYFPIITPPEDYIEEGEYVAQVMECHPSTVRQGREDIVQLPEDSAPDRVRKKGGPQKLS